MHRTQDTYPLSHLRQHMKDHLARVKDGAVETMSPSTPKDDLLPPEQAGREQQEHQRRPRDRQPGCR